MGKRDELKEYIFNTPGNTNPAILEQKIDSVVAEEGGEGGSEPVLISKTITENGTYSAADDNADGYSEVVAEVPTGGGGGGGESNFSYAPMNFKIRATTEEATLINAKNIEFICPNIQNIDSGAPFPYDQLTFGNVVFTIPAGANATYLHTVTVIIPSNKGAFVESLPFLTGDEWEISGNIEQIETSPSYLITGECTLTLVIGDK